MNFNHGHWSLYQNDGVIMIFFYFYLQIQFVCVIPIFIQMYLSTRWDHIVLWSPVGVQPCQAWTLRSRFWTMTGVSLMQLHNIIIMTWSSSSSSWSSSISWRWWWLIWRSCGGDSGGYSTSNHEHSAASSQVTTLHSKKIRIWNIQNYKGQRQRHSNSCSQVTTCAQTILFTIIVIVYQSGQFSQWEFCFTSFP